MKMLCGKVHSHDAQSICLDRDLVFFDKCIGGTDF
jgi:hypothetical protein